MQKRTKFQVRSDASKQRWVRDDRKEAYWRKQKAYWKESGLSKRAYCIANDIPESSFNAWCREIDLRDREKIRSKSASDLLGDDSADAKNPFVPLRILPDALKDPVVISETKEVTPSKERIEILVPGGAILVIPDGCNVNFVADLFSALKDVVPTCST